MYHYCFYTINTINKVYYIHVYTWIDAFIVTQPPTKRNKGIIICDAAFKDNKDEWRDRPLALSVWVCTHDKKQYKTHTQTLILSLPLSLFCFFKG